eukprot:CAMPEP_0194558780 /NCGR_PEP_ID=MMETSP0292-20121207/569_1 /TAXON_ID=39354 /ORGANISM="Heterosigma akashiwo, Strain CCMP2393" /LENGTH=311 /DNA_ID=CAMNT_0039406519 /DNA_START=56 /DNA_END=992 /DNA_ORIENTATION=+
MSARSKTEDALSFKNKLEKAMTKESEGQDQSERLVDLLGRLGEFEMTVEILRDTKIGATVSKVRKHSNADIAASGKALIKKWKKVATASAAAPAAGLQRSVSSASDTGTEEAAASTGAAAPAPASGGAVGRPAEDSREALGEPRPGVRGRAPAPAGPAGDDIEVAADKMFELGTNPQQKKRDYGVKIRQINFNIKKNKELRDRIVNGEIAPANLVKMDADDFKTDAELEEKKRIQQQKLEESRMDWAQANNDKLNAMCGITKDEGLFTCARCKSKRTTHNQKQTRSSDEPMTVFAVCLDCGHRWKFSDSYF